MLSSVIKTLPANDFMDANAATNSVILFEGDSLTAGYGSSHAPDFYVTMPSGWTKISDGHPAKSQDWIYRNADTNISPNFAKKGKLNILVDWSGANDFSTKAVADIFAQKVQYIKHMRALGWKVLVCTMPDISNTNYAQAQTKKNDLNALIAAEWRNFADGLIDLMNAPNIGATGSCTNSTYYQTDGVHLKDAGNVIVGQVMQAGIDNFLASLQAGTAGQVLTSNGPNALPTFQNAPSGGGSGGGSGNPLGEAKAWVKWSTLGGVLTINDSYNIASGVRNAAGDVTFTFTTPFANTNYVAIPGERATSTQLLMNQRPIGATYDQTTSTFRTTVVNTVNGQAVDNKDNMLVFFGQQ